MSLSFKDLKILLKRRFGGGNTPKNTEDEEEDDKPIDEKKPGDVKMVGGEHGQVYGVKRKIVGGFIALCVVIVGAAFIFNLSDKKEKTRKPAQPPRQEEAATVSSSGGSKGDSDYEALFKANEAATRSGRRNNGQNQGANGNKQATEESEGNTNSAISEGASVARQQRSAPAITTPNYPTVASVPSVTYPSAAYPAAVPATAPASTADSEEKRAQKDLENRYSSAIAFALGHNPSNTGTANTDGSDANGAASQGTQAQPGKGAKVYQYTAPSNAVLQAGALIPAILFTGINTDIAGQVTAQVMSDVYDTATRSTLLIPMGSQLIGTYEAGNGSGNGRVNLTFTTVVLPNGGSYSIDGSMVAVDGAGYNGLKGKVDHHTDKLIGKGLLSSAFNAISNIGVDRVTLDMRGMTGNLLDTSNIKETVTIEPGREFNLFVTKPIFFRQ